MDKNQLLRSIPKVDVLLSHAAAQKLISMYGYDCVLTAIRQEQERLRGSVELYMEKEMQSAAEAEQCAGAQSIAEAELRAGAQSTSEAELRAGTQSTSEAELRVEAGEQSAAEWLRGEPEARVMRILDNAERALEEMYRPQLKKVLNGTGTILHTNLGRAPIAEKHLEAAQSVASGYLNLEYDLEAGTRGDRGAAVEALLCKITGAEAAVVVNNNAAAVLLVLNSVAKGGEVIVSRGELVEIGGHFRIPDVMELSGARLAEVGTTNKTRLSDYEHAVIEETKAFLKVHTSNYRIVGFTEAVGVEELKELQEKIGEREIPIIVDLGSGSLIDLSRYGLPGEPTVQEELRRGADIVCFSGDKLLGGPQAGIIVGSRRYIDRMRTNPFYRAMRIGKLTASVLENVLLEYLSESRAIQNIPALRMMTKKPEAVKRDAEELKELLERAGFAAEFELCSCDSQIGGGSLPLTVIASTAVAIAPEEIRTEELERRLCRLPIPVVGRIEKGKLLLDLRTFEMGYAETFVKMLEEAEVFS